MDNFGAEEKVESVTQQELPPTTVGNDSAVAASSSNDVPVLPGIAGLGNLPLPENPSFNPAFAA